MSRRTAILLVMLLSVAACEREDRTERKPPPEAAALSAITMGELRPGADNKPPSDSSSGYDRRAYDVSEGKRLYRWFNCNGCHANGGGNIGPPFLDEQWIYGHEPANVVASILQGRPNGMPSFRGRISEEQAWQIAAYVRSMSRLIRKDVAPGRSDHINSKPAESSVPRENNPKGSDEGGSSLQGNQP